MDRDVGNIKEGRGMNITTLPNTTKLFCGILMTISIMLLLLADKALAQGATPLETSGSSFQQVATFEIATNDAEAVTYNSNSRHIWIYGKQRLQAFQPDGSQVVDRLYPELPPSNSKAAMLAEGEKLWLVIDRSLYQFDHDGSLIKQRSFRDTIHAIHFDSRLSQILIATDKYVIVLDAQGKEVDRIRTRLSNIA